MNSLVSKIAGLPFAKRGWNGLVYVRGLFRRELRLNRLYDRCTIRVMSEVLRSDSHCIDVGCHTGQMLEPMLQFAPAGKHFAFEPIPRLASQLRERFPQVDVYEVALSDSSGTAAFRHVVSRPAYSGLRERAYPNAQEETELIDVRTERLDNILDDAMPIRFLKIDVEGGELQVLSGAERTLQNHKPFVVFEHGIGAADYYGTRPEQVYDLLVERCKMNVSLLQDWLAKKEPLSRREFVAEFDNHTNFYFLAHP